MGEGGRTRSGILASRRRGARGSFQEATGGIKYQSNVSLNNLIIILDLHFLVCTKFIHVMELMYTQLTQGGNNYKTRKFW